MSLENAKKFAQKVMEDNELRERTAKLNPEELLPIAKEMGCDFTEEELTAVMNETQELTADQLEAAAGGYYINSHPDNVDMILKEKARQHCHHSLKGPLHQWVKIDHEERWMFWAWTRGYDIYKCSLCGETREQSV